MTRKNEIAAPKIARVVRAKDWPASMHKAYDRMEAAGDAMVAFGQTAEEYEATLAAFTKAKAACGREALALDKVRRPAFYGLPPVRRETLHPNALRTPLRGPRPGCLPR